MSPSLALAIVALAVSLAPQGGPARGGAAATSPPPLWRDADSLADLRRARAAQERVERARRRRLPALPSRAACEVAIGRYCYWYDPAEPPAPVEPPRTAQDRDALVALLDTLAARRPGDDWIAGQRVRYLLESARHTDAVAAAARCAGTAWWCAALRGLALHESGRFAAAAAAYDSALAAMPGTRRCAWRDIGPLIAGQFRSRYRAASCARRREMEQRFWWLARPFHAAEANELETEHLARRTWSRILRDAWSPHGRWSADQAAMALRYGWPVAWSRDRARETYATAAGTEHVRGHEAAPSWAWIPAPRLLGSPYDATASDWQLAARAAVARYAPRGLRSVTALSHQIARFRRGDSLLVVAVYDAGADTALRGAKLDVALALSADERSAPRVARARSNASHGWLELSVPAAPQLLSLEARAFERRGAALTRRGIRPLSRGGPVVLSDILLLAPLGVVPERLAEAMPLAVATDTIAVETKVGLFWEAYAPSAPDSPPATVAVRLSRVRASAGRRVAEALRLEERPLPVTVRWDADARRPIGAGAAPAVGSTAIMLDLARRPPGHYRIEVTLTAPGGGVARRTRDLHIAAPGAGRRS